MFSSAGKADPVGTADEAAGGATGGAAGGGVAAKAVPEKLDSLLLVSRVAGIDDNGGG